MKKKRKLIRIFIFSLIFPKNWRHFASFILTLTVKILGLKAKYQVAIVCRFLYEMKVFFSLLIVCFTILSRTIENMNLRNAANSILMIVFLSCHVGADRAKMTTTGVATL